MTLLLAHEPLGHVFQRHEYLEAGGTHIASIGLGLGGTAMRSSLGVFGVLLLVLTGCARPSPRYDDLGAAHVAIISVAPWHRVRADLQPTFPITPAAALSQAIATTQASDDLRSRSTAADIRLQYGLTELLAPDTEAPPEASRTAVGKSSLGVPLRGNAMHAIWAATALYQEVQLVNRYIRDAAVGSKNYRPYIVRLQASVMPNSRSRPYDVYSVISFFSGRGGKGGVMRVASEGDARWRTPRVVPLIVTDAIEQAARSSSNERLRDIAVGLDAMVQGVGGKVSVNDLDRRIAELIGHEANSLLTVARVSENTMRVRIGAANQAGRDALHLDRAMVPRTHNITVLLLVPEEVFAEKDAEEAGPVVEVIWTNEFVHAETGVAAPKRPDHELLDGLHNAVFDWTFDDDGWIKYWNHGGLRWRRRAWLREPVRSDILGLAKPMLMDNFNGFHEELTSIVKERSFMTSDALWDSRVLAIWHEVSDERIRTRAGVMRLTMPEQERPSLLRETIATVLDDDTAAIVHLPGVGTGLAPWNLSARLEFSREDSGQERIVLAAHAIDVTDDGSSVKLSFPSPARFGVVPKAPAVILSLGGPDAGEQACTLRAKASYLKVTKKPPATTPPVLLGSTSSVVRAHQARANVILSVLPGGLRDGSPQEPRLRVRGAMVESLRQLIGADDAAPPIHPVTGAYAVQAKTDYRLELSALDAGTPIVVELRDKADKVLASVRFDVVE